MANTELVYKVSAKVLGEDIFNSYAEDYNTRLIVQKTMYVFQEAAKKDLFGYSWYVAGPYSPKVTDIIYNSVIPNLEVKRHVWNNLEFSAQGSERVKKVEKFLTYSEKERADTNLDKSGFYELIVSMLYLHNNYHTDKDATSEKLKSAKSGKFDCLVIEKVVNNYWQRIEAFAA
jgi:uncharacterized protein YwgA